MIVSTHAPSAVKGLLLAIVAGALMWIMFPLINKARVGDFGLGPYSLTMHVLAGRRSSRPSCSICSSSTFPWMVSRSNCFLISGRARRPPGGVRLGDHAVRRDSGVFRGARRSAGDAVKAADRVRDPQGAVLVAAVVGIFGWKDFRDAEPRVRAMVWSSWCCSPGRDSDGRESCGGRTRRMPLRRPFRGLRGQRFVFFRRQRPVSRATGQRRARRH